MKEISFRNDILPLKEKLFRTALRITMDSAEAEDVVQDTLIRVWNKREEWPNIISIEAYCMTICRNLALDRNERMGTDYIEIDEQVHKLTDATTTPPERLEQQESLKLAQHLLNQLPEKQRLIMELREIEGKSYKEIAVMLDISEEQVKVNLFRARQKIKKQFSEINQYGL